MLSIEGKNSGLGLNLTLRSGEQVLMEIKGHGAYEVFFLDLSIVNTQ